MKRMILFIFFLSFLTGLYALDKPNSITVIEGLREYQILRDAQAVTIVFTFNGTKVYGQPLDDYVKERIRQGFRVNKKKMMDDFFESAKTHARDAGGEWNMHVVGQNEKPGRQNNMIIIEINYDDIVSIPPFMANGSGVVKIYGANSPKNVLYKGNINATIGIKGNPIPRVFFSKMGFGFVRSVINFLKKDIEEKDDQ